MEGGLGRREGIGMGDREGEMVERIADALLRW